MTDKKPNGTGQVTQDIKVRSAGRGSEQFTVQYKIGSTLDELVAQFGAETVGAKAAEKIIVNLQDYLRNNAKKGKTTAELQALADKWVPGVRAAGTSKADKAKDLFASLSAEDRAAIMQQYAPS